MQTNEFGHAPVISTTAAAQQSYICYIRTVSM